MSNVRNAGRKSKLSSEQIDELIDKVNNGESVTKLSTEYGMTRQAIYNMLKADRSDGIIRLDYVYDGEIATVIEADYIHEQVNIVNYAGVLSKRVFGYSNQPTWEELKQLLENQYFANRSVDLKPGRRVLLCSDFSPADFGIEEVINISKDKAFRLSENNNNLLNIKKIPRFEFTKKDILYSRTDTDGFAFKALSSDHKWFVKGQTIISGITMDDWAVEVIASDLCRQLKIPCVEQFECVFVYAGREHHGVCSKNFELDGKSFISFERLIERVGRSTRDDEFIKLDALSKLKWCSQMLSEAGNIPYERTERYMLDLAIIDILVGNVDRHTHNFGLFYDNQTQRYEIPLIFDNGMGLFEHDDYRDRYESYDAAMGRVYINPYGEDPFDMLRMLEEEYDLVALYPALTEFRYKDILHKPFATEYMERMCLHWQK